MLQKVLMSETIPPTAAVEAELSRHGEQGKLLRRLLRIAKDRDALQAGQPISVEEIPGNAEEMSQVFLSEPQVSNFQLADASVPAPL